MPYYSQPQHPASSIQVPSQSNQRHSFSSRTIYPTSSLPISTSGNSLGRHSFDNSSTSGIRALQTSANNNPLTGRSSNVSAAPIKQTIGGPLLPSKFSSSRMEFKSTTATPSRANVSSSTTEESSQASISKIGFCPNLKPPELPKRTVFSQNHSIGSLGSPPNYSQNIAEMMQAVQSQRLNQTQNMICPSFSPHYEPPNALSSSKGTKPLGKQHPDTSGKFISPIHNRIAGDICDNNTSLLNTTGKFNQITLIIQF